MGKCLPPETVGMSQALVRTLAVAALLAAPPAHALIAVGAPAPDFTKNQLAGGPGSWSKGGAVSLGDYAGKVVVLFLLGYS